uniref:SH3 domain-binding glutamic acid-rich protein n=2 Tax=Ascaris suum TaxID=6253 RepID=F1L7G0_ASCSU
MSPKSHDRKCFCAYHPHTTRRFLDVKSARSCSDANHNKRTPPRLASEWSVTWRQRAAPRRSKSPLAELKSGVCWLRSYVKATMPLNVYIASITGNTEIRKQVQRTLMILEGLGVPFNAIDITLRGNDKQREFMRENAINERWDGVPLPPQFFHNDTYIGNYFDFEEAVEDNHLPEFLRLIPPSSSDSKSKKEGDEKDKQGSDQ